MAELTPLQIKTPRAARRQKAIQHDWLLSLDRAAVEKRLGRSGSEGFYAHEKLCLARYCIFADLREQLQANLKEKEASRQDQERRREAMRDKMASDAERRRELMEASCRGLRMETHRSVRKAAMRTANLYLGSPIPRTLKQSIAIAAREHEIAWAAIQAYLAGVGVRTLWEQEGDEDEGPDDGQEVFKPIPPHAAVGSA